MNKAKEKVAAKVAEKKEKIAKKLGRKTAAVAMAIALGCFAGCAGADPSSRSTSGEYGDIKPEVKIVFEEGANSNTVNLTMPLTVGDAAVASADSSGSTETQTATPTNTTDVKPNTNLNTTGGRSAGVAESLVSAFGTWLTTPSGKEAVSQSAAPAAQTAQPATDAKSGSCTDGSCTLGSCGRCSE